MRNVVLGIRWVALPTASFFLVSLATGVAREAAVAAPVLVGVAVIVASVVDLAVLRR